MANEYLQAGGVVAIAALVIREMFAYLKTLKKNGNDIGYNKQVFDELKLMNTNHLDSIYKAIQTGNNSLIETIHHDNITIIGLLGEIKGKLK